MVPMDVKYAIRSILRAPFFTAAVIVLLAFGLGANAVIFTAVDTLLLRPLPVTKPEQLFHLGIRYSPTIVSFDSPYFYGSMTQSRTQSFSTVFGTWPWDTTLISGKHSENVSAETVSGNYFSSLGLSPATGRLLTSADESSDAQVAVLSSRLAQRLFPTGEAVGSTIRLHGTPFTVVGVVDGFSGVDLDRRTDAWVTKSALKQWFSQADTQRSPTHLLMRLKEGVSRERAEAELRASYPSIVEADYATRTKTTRADVDREKSREISLESVERGTSRLRKTFVTAATALMGAVGLLLILVCLNVGGLMLARAETQLRDTTIRLSLGATRWETLRRIFLEVFFVSIGGALGGWLIAIWCSPLLLRLLPQRIPLAIDFSPNIRVLIFTSTACVLTTLLLSMLPAWWSLRVDPSVLLSRSGSGRVSGRKIGRTLVACQVALSTVLLLGGLTLVRTLEIMRQQDPGFRRQNLVVMKVNPGISGVHSEKLPETFDEIVRRAETIPGVEQVSLAELGVMRGIGMVASVGPAGKRSAVEDALKTSMNMVSASHLSNAGIRLIQGRNLQLSDEELRPNPVIVSEGFARRFFPEGNAIGQTIGIASPGEIIPPSNQIVGIVSDTKYRSMREVPPPTIYVYLNKEKIRSSNGLLLHVTTHSDPGGIIQQLQTMLREIGPGLIASDVATMEQEIETSLWQERLLATLASLFATSAAILAGLGLFGMLAYAVSQRTREIGIRMAIGATIRRIFELIVRDAATSVFPRFLAGIALYFLVSRGLMSLLYGVQPWNTFSVAIASACVLTVAALATLVPALRAISVQPSVALKEE